MIIDYIEPWNLPHIIVWMDWQLYSRFDVFVLWMFLSTVVYFTFVVSSKCKGKPTFVEHTVAHIFGFFIYAYIAYGGGVG